MYKLIKDPMTGNVSCVQNIDTTAFIPFDPANIDYQEYLKWLSEGNTPEPAEEVTN